MVRVKVLIEGFVKNDIHIVPTTTLIQDGNINIIVDPGMGKNKPQIVKEALGREGLSFNDISINFITHYHPDHTQFVGLFPRAKLIDYKYIYNGNKWTDHEGEGYKISPNVSIMHTPGHSIEHASLAVKTSKGLVVVAGDVWWFFDMTPKKDEMAWSQEKLANSRKKVLRIAEWIIPGHGKIFRNLKKEQSAKIKRTNLTPL